MLIPGLNVIIGTVARHPETDLIKQRVIQFQVPQVLHVREIRDIDLNPLNGAGLAEYQVMAAGGFPLEIAGELRRLRDDRVCGMAGGCHCKADVLHERVTLGSVTGIQGGAMARIFGAGDGREA
jgi:hypothetical protein